MYLFCGIYSTERERAEDIASIDCQQQKISTRTDRLSSKR